MLEFQANQTLTLSQDFYRTKNELLIIKTDPQAENFVEKESN